MGKLYMVKVERTIVVWADNETLAEMEATSATDAEMECGEPDYVCAAEVASVADVPAGWMNSIPIAYDGDDDATCGDILSR
jgi:hypothetical protein